MTVEIFCGEKPEFSFKYRALARRVIEAALAAEGFPLEAEVSLLLVGREEIRRMNLDARGIDAETDVLSFPMLEFTGPADFSDLAEGPDCLNPDTGEVVLGDIVICLDKVREQAEAYGHSEKREYAFLITHSMLHLMGYDHMEEADRLLMEDHQRMILDSLGIQR